MFQSSLRQAEIALLGEISEPILQNPYSARSRNFDRTIRAERIQEYNIIRPPHRFQAGWEILFLVIREDEDRDHLPSNDRCLITRAGLPATTDHGSTFFITTARAPTTAPSPTITPGPMKASAQIHA